MKDFSLCTWLAFDTIEQNVLLQTLVLKELHEDDFSSIYFLNFYSCMQWSFHLHALTHTHIDTEIAFLYDNRNIW